MMNKLYICIYTDINLMWMYKHWNMLFLTSSFCLFNKNKQFFSFPFRFSFLLLNIIIIIPYFLYFLRWKWKNSTFEINLMYSWINKLGTARDKEIELSIELLDASWRVFRLFHLTKRLNVYIYNMSANQRDSLIQWLTDGLTSWLTEWLTDLTST